MKKILKKISKLLNKMPNIKCEMILFLYPILSFYGTVSFYSEQAIILNDVKDLILFTFAWYVHTIGLYIISGLLIDAICYAINKIKK